MARLVLLIFALARTGRHGLSAAAVGAYLGSALWFSSSTSFAKASGDDWADVLRHVCRDRPRVSSLFIAAQLVGGAIGEGLRKCYPDAADGVVMQCDADTTRHDALVGCTALVRGAEPAGTTSARSWAKTAAAVWDASTESDRGGR